MKQNLKSFGVSDLITYCCFGIVILLYLIQFAVIQSEPIVSVQIVSCLGVLELILIILNWRNTYYRILSPSFIVIVALFFVLCGQSVMWCVGLDAGYRDLIKSPNWGFSDLQIVKGLLFAQVCIFLLHYTVIFSISRQTKKTKEIKSARSSSSIAPAASYNAILFVAFAILAISIGPYIIDFYQTYSYVQIYGYDRAYDLITYGFDSIFAKIGAFFPVSVVMILFCWGKKSNLNQQNYIRKAIVCYCLIGAVLLTSLALGRRTNVILYALALMLIWFKDKKMTRSTVISFVVICIVGMAGMRFIDMFRSGNVESIMSFFNVIGASNSNPIIDFLGDIGWNLLSTIEIQSFIPDVKDYSYGLTYLASLTSIIPNLDFWTIHPATEYGMASTWLQETMGLSYGVGFSPIAEAYYNFGFFGPLVFIIWGRLLVLMNRLFEAPSDPFRALIPIIFTGVIAKSFVRSCFAAVFRPAFLYMVLIPLLVYFVAKQLDTRKGIK